MEFQLSNNLTALSAISLSVVAASISGDVFSWGIMFESDFVSEVKIISSFFINTMDTPNNSMIDLVFLDSMDQREQLCGKAELSIISSEVIIYDRCIEHDILSAFNDVFVCFSFFR